MITCELSIVSLPAVSDCDRPEKFSRAVVHMLASIYPRVAITRAELVRSLVCNCSFYPEFGHWPDISSPSSFLLRMKCQFDLMMSQLGKHRNNYIGTLSRILIGKLRASRPAYHSYRFVQLW